MNISHSDKDENSEDDYIDIDYHEYTNIKMVTVMAVLVRLMVMTAAISHKNVCMNK